MKLFAVSEAKASYYYQGNENAELNILLVKLPNWWKAQKRTFMSEENKSAPPFEGKRRNQFYFCTILKENSIL